MDGMRMLREEEGATEEEIGFLCSGFFFCYSKKRTVANREGQQSDFEERNIG
jgi:hypothetical protein